MTFWVEEQYILNHGRGQDSELFQLAERVVCMGSTLAEKHRITPPLLRGTKWGLGHSNDIC